jgi:hypothetical protein
VHRRRSPEHQEKASEGTKNSSEREGRARVRDDDEEDERSEREGENTENTENTEEHRKGW